MANPFYVSPGNNLSQGLAGLTQSITYLGEQKAKQRAKEKYEKMKMEGTAAFATKDPDIIAKFMIENPEMAKAMDISYGFYDKATKENYLKGAYEILEAHEMIKKGGGSVAPVAPLGESPAPMTAAVPSPQTGIEAAGEYPYDPSIRELEEPPGTPFLNASSEPMANPFADIGMPEGTPIPTPAPAATGLPPEITKVLQERKDLLNAKGVPPEKTQQTDAFAAAYSANPEAAVQKIEHDIATMDPKGWKAWKEIYRPTEKEGSTSQLNKWIRERNALLKEGYAEDSPKVKAYDDRIWPEDKGKTGTPSSLRKMMTERDTLKEDLLEQGYEDPDKHPDVIAFNNKIMNKEATKSYGPSPILKMINERNKMIEDLTAEGYEDPTKHPDVVAIENKIQGIDLNVEDLTPEQYRFHGTMAYITGKMPSVGRGKMATKVRMGILKEQSNYAMETAKDEMRSQGMDVSEGVGPMAAFKAIGTQSDTKSIQGALNALEKQTASMGSFVENMDKQMGRMRELSEDIKLYDTRLLNVPYRLIAQKGFGNPNLNKWDTYIKEISRETTKLALGATQSIAPPSEGELKTWDRIHDPNLSVKDVLEVLEESRHAAGLRYDSVLNQRNRTRGLMRDRTKYKVGSEATPAPTINTQEEYDALPSGSWYTDPDTNKRTRKR